MANPLYDVSLVTQSGFKWRMGAVLDDVVGVSDDTACCEDFILDFLQNRVRGVAVLERDDSRPSQNAGDHGQGGDENAGGAHFGW